jgi:hypothetical protein
VILRLVIYFKSTLLTTFSSGNINEDHSGSVPGKLDTIGMLDLHGFKAAIDEIPTKSPIASCLVVLLSRRVALERSYLVYGIYTTIRQYLNPLIRGSDKSSDSGGV